MKKQETSIISLFFNTFFILMGIVVATIVFVLLVLCLKTNKTTKEISDFNGYKPIICISDSMAPEFNAGDIVISKMTENDAINIGDIITFRKNGEIITHRVENIVEENGYKKYVTKGDNNNIEDEEMISYNQIEGKIIYTIPVLGKIILMLKNPLGFLVVFFIPIGLLAITYKIMLDRKNLKEMRKRKLLKRLQSRMLLDDK